MADENGEERRTIHSRLRFLLILLLILAAISALLHLEKFRRLKDIGRGKEKLAALVRSRPVEATMARRARFYQIQYFLGYPPAASYAAADLARRIAAIAAPLRLLSVQIDPGVHDLGFELTVEAATGGPGEARRLAVFLERLRHVPNVVLADLSGPGAGIRGGGVRVYTVNGRAELQP